MFIRIRCDCVRSGVTSRVGVYSYHGSRRRKRTSIRLDRVPRRSFAEAEIRMPEGIRRANKCRWPLIAAARADVGQGTALLGEELGRGVAIAWLPLRVNHAGANAKGTDRRTPN